MTMLMLTVMPMSTRMNADHVVHLDVDVSVVINGQIEVNLDVDVDDVEYNALRCVEAGQSQGRD